MDWKPVQVRDEDGKGFEFLQKDDLVMPTFLKEVDVRLKLIKELPYSRDDVLLCSYPKTVPFGNYFDYYKAWEKEIANNKKLDVIVVHFEKLKENGLEQMQRIQKFLGLNHPDARLHQILDKCTVKNMKADVESGKVMSPLVDEKGKSFLYRKGEVGDWKNYFTVSQSEQVDRIVEEKLKNSIFKP